MQECIKKILGSKTTTPITANDDIEHIIKIIKSPEDYSELLLKIVNERIQNEFKEQKRGFLSVLLGTWGASLLGNMLGRKGINRAGEGFIKARCGSKRSSIKGF